MSYYHSPYFPARNIFRKSSDGGAWLVAYKEEQKKRFNAVLCPLTQEESEISKKTSKVQKLQSVTKSDEKVKILDGVYLLKHMNVNYPSDLAYINIIGENLTAGKAEDFVLFDHVSHIEAGENNLTIDAFKTFPDLWQLELQLNGITSLNVTSSDFKYLEVLNLSFNNLKPAEVLCLGTLVSLKCLHLTGNGLKVLPAEMANKYKHGSRKSRSGTRRFHKLESLYLDENDIEDISVFASLAPLPKLKVLNLAKNKLQCVPQLRLMVSNLYQTHVLPTVDCIDEKGEYDATEATHKTSNDTKPREAVGEKTDNNTDDIDLQEAVNPTEEAQVGHSDENPQEEPVKQEVEGLENDWGPGFDGDFQYEKDVEDNDLGLELGINQQETDTELSGDSGDLDFFLDELECPFPNLEKIDLTHNLIAEDQALLPLSTWPSLLEVNIWKNPLVKNRRGISALLQYHLTNLCGIKINRKEPRKTCKPSVGPSIAPIARYNKINDVMPPLRQKNMLLLEFEKYEASVKGNSLTGKPLPSISSGRNESIARKSRSAPIRQFNDAGDEITAQRPRSAANLLSDMKFKINKDASDFGKSKDDFQSEEDQSGVFLTQVDVNDEESQAAHDKEDMDPVNDTKVDSKAIECIDKGQEYDTIEGLLKTDELFEFNDTPPESDVHANLNALKMALSNPLVFNESSQKTLKETKYVRPPQSRKTISPRKTRQDQVLTTLDGMKKQSNIIEENLDVVLENYDKDTRLKRQFPHVKRLLKDVQSRYDQVRLTSLDSARNAQTLIQSTIKNAYDSRNNPSFKGRENETEETKLISSRSTGGIKIDPSNDAIKTLDKFKEAVNSRI